MVYEIKILINSEKPKLTKVCYLKPNNNNHGTFIELGFVTAKK